MNIQLLYPYDPFNEKSRTAIDPEWLEEATAARNAGLELHNINMDDPAQNKRDFTNKNFIYRGWMLTPTEYEQMNTIVNNCGGTLVFTPEQYSKTHHLPGWYSEIQDYTARTEIVTDLTELKNKLSTLNWKAGYFLKDFVKSLKTGIGSVISNIEDVPTVLEQMTHFRGKIEGGICIREYTKFKENTETRLFAYKNQVFSPSEDTAIRL